MAICKNCQRALCPECARELENGIACKDRCEEQVEFINSVYNRNLKAITHRKRFILRTFLFPFIAGLIFLIYGIYSFTGHGLDYFLISVGSLFVLSSLFTLLNARSLEERKNRSH